MRQHPTRRDFLASSAAGIGYWAAGGVARAASKSPNERLNIGVVAVVGRGGANLAEVGKTENVVALCDVDSQRLGKAGLGYPKAEKYGDFRKMLEQKKIDAVVVSTPDHSHAICAVPAMQLGKHVYCEKPLAHSVYETRVMREAAAKYQVVTQMGNQGHATDRLRGVVELIRSGAIGNVTEVVCWSDKIFSGGKRPTATPPVPKTLDWKLWLGPAPVRPYHSAYHPRHWRGWWDFGVGNYGDMACHIIDAAYWALDLGYPTRISTEGPVADAESAPDQLIVRYEFPSRGSQPPVKLTWYDGKKAPPMKQIDGVKLPGQGSLMIGEKGKILFPHHLGPVSLLPKKKFLDFKQPQPTLPRPTSHHLEWIQAIKGEGQTQSSFEYGGRMTETILAGIVAYRMGKTLEWDGQSMTATNCSEAKRLIHPKLHNGWTL